jgi:sugar phosphate isomerase/epimerase
MVEIIPESFDLIEAGRVRRDYLKRLKGIVEQFPVACSIHAPARLNLYNTEQKQMHNDVFAATLEICTELNAHICVYHPGRPVDSCEYLQKGKPERSAVFSKYLQRQEAETIQKMADRYPHITIAMENQRPYKEFSPWSYGEDIPVLISQIRSIARKNVAMAFDTGHLNLADTYFGTNSLSCLVENRDMIIHTHIQDNHGIPNFPTDRQKSAQLPFGIGDEHLPPGRGTFPFHTYADVFQGYRGTFLLELRDHFMTHSQLREAVEFIHQWILNEGITDE